jgi:TonB family protein
LREVEMKENALLVLFFSVAMIVASPLTLLADKTGDQYEHASDLLSQGDLQGAQTELEAILQKKPGHKNAKVLLGLTLTKLSEQSEKQGDRTSAVAQLREALRLDPDEPYAHSALAKLLHAQGDADEAMKECSLAAQLSPDDSGLAGGCGLGARREIWEDDTYPWLRFSPGAHISTAQGEVTPPYAKKHSEPPYTEKARAAVLQGTVVLWLVVGVHGDVEQAAVEKPLGLGLDQNALRTVCTWKFNPGTRNGTPIPTRVKVEMSFRLF